MQRVAVKSYVGHSGFLQGWSRVTRRRCRRETFPLFPFAPSEFSYMDMYHLMGERKSTLDKYKQRSDVKGQ